MASKNVGDLSIMRQVIDEITFQWYGHTLRANPNVSDLEFYELTQLEIEEDDPQSAIAATKATVAYLRSAIHPQDWNVWWGEAKSHGLSMTDLMNVAYQLTELISGFPTTPPPDSSSGQSNTPPKSLQKTIDRPPRKRSRRDRDMERAFGMFDGRPDLKLAAFIADEQGRQLVKEG